MITFIIVLQQPEFVEGDDDDVDLEVSRCRLSICS
jgi:hypothetical protein